mgnify:FL=1
MARVRTKERAVAIHEIYKKIAAEYNPVVIYSGISNSLKKDALQQIESGTSKIIVCVNMLGEGYDLPQLKIAAMHDVHKSLAITLQFIGRFARVSAATTIGEASVVVERSGFYGDDNLARLYSSDPDWNKIIVDLSENAVEEQEEINDFENDFKDLPPEISLKNLLPKMSTVIYKTKVSNWKPHSIYEEIPKSRLYTNKIALNDKDQVAWFVTKDKSAIPWGNVEGLDQLSYNLYILYWDKTNKLLYIYSSNKDTVHARIAKAVCGESAELQHGNVVYRALANVNRLIPTTVGLLDGRNRKRQFTMYSGPNVTSGLPNSVTGTKVQTNMFGSGYEAGKRVDLGISLKGRIWSRKAAPTLMHWKSWCDYYGAKIIDSTIDVDTIMNQFLIPKFVENRPSLIPLSLAWPFSVYLPSSDGAMVSINGKSQNISDCELILKNHIKSGPISFYTNNQWV